MSKLHKDESRISGVGLYSSADYKKDQTIAYIHGPIVIVRKWTKALSARSLNWIGAGKYSWIDTAESPFRFINHSCNPNVAIVTKRKVIALKSIPAGTELVMDYSLTESDTGWEIQCKCESANCRKVIRSIQSLRKSDFKKHSQHIPENFKKIYSQAQSS